MMNTANLKQELNCHFRSQSMQVNYSNLSPSSTTSSTYSISPQDLQNMIINTNQMYLNNSSTTSNSPSSSTSSMSSPNQLKSESYSTNQYSSNANEQYLDISMSEDLDSTNNDGQTACNTSKSVKTPNSGNKVNRFFADGVVDILNKWFNENQNYPYPDENMTNILAKEANISAKQVRKWFANKRVRSNKCCKQSRIQQPRKDSNRTRRQTRSVSEVDNVQLTFNMTDSDEFNTTNIDNMLDDNLNDSNVIKRNYTNNNSSNNRRHKRSSLYINSSGALSTSPTFIESSPIFTNDKTSQFSTKNESFYESSRFDDIRIKKEQQHQQQQELFDSLKLNNLLLQHQQQQQDASILCNNIINSTAAIYPLIVMNLLQNPIALQTALANQIMNTNLNAALGSSAQQAPSPNESSTEYKAYNKRKTHLSNRFYRENNETSIISPELSIELNSKQQIDSNKCSSSSSSSSSADPEEYNTTPTSTSSCSSYSSPLTMFESYKDFNQMQSQQQQILHQQHNQPKPTRKINFGDISDLIN